MSAIAGSAAPLRLSDLPDFPALQQLHAALWQTGESRGAAVMVGAGFSRAARRDGPDTPVPPLWTDFAARMTERLGESAVADPLKLAEEYQAAFDRRTLDDLIRELVADSRWSPAAMHERLLGLPWADVLTTNWDTLLERTPPSDPERTYEVVLTPADIPRTRAPRIVKLHGTLPAHPPFVFTSEDFRRYPRDFAPFVNLAQQVLLENELCLIGFSGDDPNFLAWTGWVRDQLGAAARRIRLVGVLNLTTARRRVLERNGVTPIDLAPLVRDLDPADQHLAALQLLIDGFWAAKPTPRHAWALTRDWSDEAPAGSIEELRGLATGWREERLTYPNWLVAPPDLRDRLGHNTFALHYKHKKAFEDADAALRAGYLVERVWRLETALISLDEWTRDRVTELVEAPPPSLGRAELVDLLLSLVRDARYAHDWTRFDASLGRVQALEPGRADIAYERALRARDLQDDAGLKALIGTLTGDDPVWLLRRAALKAELGDADGAGDDIGRALRELRRQRARDRQSVALISREAWATFLARAAGMAKWETGSEREDELAARRYAEARSDPWAHFQAVDRKIQTFAARRQQDERPIEARFDPGAYRDHSNMTRIVSSDGSTELRAFVRLVDLVGLPQRMGMVGVSGHIVRNILSEIRYPSDIEVRTAARYLEDHDKGLIDRFFSRVGVARLPLGLVEDVARNARSGVEAALDGAREDWQWAAVARTKLELVSRMILRLPPAACLEHFRWGLSLMRDPRLGHWWVHESLEHLLSRALDGVPPPDRTALVFEAFMAPLPGERPQSAHHDDWPNLAELFRRTPIDRPADDAAWTRRIGELIERARAFSNDRPGAIHWLLLLQEAGVLTPNETTEFGVAIWAQTKPGSLPEFTGLVAHAFLTLPDPSQTGALPAFLQKTVEPLAKGEITESRLWALHGAVVRQRGVFRLDRETALQIFDALLAYRPMPIPKDRFLDNTRIVNRGIDLLLAPVLADAILAVLKPGDLTDGRASDLVEAICDRKRPTLVLAVCEAIRLLPRQQPRLLAALRAGLARQNLELTAAVDGVNRFVSPYRAPGVVPPAILATDMAAVCAVRRDAGLHHVLDCVYRLVGAGAMGTEDVERVLDTLDRLADETDYDEWEATDPRTMVLTLIRATCVKLAARLQSLGFDAPGVVRWLALAAEDPAPEVRFALSGPGKGADDD